MCECKTTIKTFDSRQHDGDVSFTKRCKRCDGCGDVFRTFEVRIDISVGDLVDLWRHLNNYKEKQLSLKTHKNARKIIKQIRGLKKDGLYTY